MRRDYFICIFLLCICASLFFVCFLPLYFTYGAIIPRDISIMEKIFSWCFALFVIVVVPIYSAVFKKFWFSLGLAAYGLIADIPEWILPSMARKVAAGNASIFTVIENYLLREMYGMVKAPFAGMAPALGNDRAVGLSKWILPVSLISYIVVQLYRYYRDAYLAEQLDPSRMMDSTAKENDREAAAARIRQTRNAEILGTVISAPVKAAPGANAAQTAKTETVVPHVTQPPKRVAPPPTSDTQVIQLGAPAAPSADTQVIQLGPPSGNNK